MWPAGRAGGGGARPQGAGPGNVYCARQITPGARPGAPGADVYCFTVDIAVSWLVRDPSQGQFTALQLEPCQSPTPVKKLEVAAIQFRFFYINGKLVCKLSIDVKNEIVSRPKVPKRRPNATTVWENEKTPPCGP